MNHENKEGRRAKRSFSEEFKREAVRLVTERPNGISFTKIARDLDLRPPQLRLWVKAFATEVEPRSTNETAEQELRRLRREVATLREERDFAKKAAVFFAKGSR
jgi:transposase